jgi:hypothetical protein
MNDESGINSGAQPPPEQVNYTNSVEQPWRTAGRETTGGPDTSGIVGLGQSAAADQAMPGNLNAGGRPLAGATLTGGGSGAVVSPTPRLGLSVYLTMPAEADGGSDESRD